MELSEAQIAAIDSAFADYRNRYAPLSEDVRQILPAVTKAWYATEPAGDGPDLLRTVRRFQARLSSIEDAFFEQMQPFLTEAQLARAPIVRDRRLRQRHLARIGVTPIGFVIARGGIGIDLRSDLMQGDDGIDRIPEVDALLRAYESRLGAMLQAYDNAYTSCMLTRKPSMDEVIATGYPILKFQREAMEQIAPLVPERIRANFRDRTLRSLYPGIEPDPHHVDVYLAQTEQMELADEQREHIDAIGSTYRTTHREMTEHHGSDRRRRQGHQILAAGQ